MEEVKLCQQNLDELIGETNQIYHLLEDNHEAVIASLEYSDMARDEQYDDVVALLDTMAGALAEIRENVHRLRIAVEPRYRHEEISRMFWRFDCDASNGDEDFADHKLPLADAYREEYVRRAMKYLACGEPEALSYYEDFRKKHSFEKHLRSVAAGELIRNTDTKGPEGAEVVKKVVELLKDEVDG